MNMVETLIRTIMKKRNLTPADIYRPLRINRVNFYKAIRTSNLSNKSLRKILNFLGYDIVVSLKKHEYKKHTNI